MNENNIHNKWYQKLKKKCLKVSEELGNSTNVGEIIILTEILIVIRKVSDWFLVFLTALIVT